MNNTYRLIWNDLTCTWVAVAECAKGRGKRASGAVLLAAAVTVFTVPAVLAAPPNPPAPTQLPTGGQVVAGQAAISQSATVLNINQTSQRAALDWQSFNIGSQAQVNFNQPGASSVTLNRVLDSNPSQIFGRITAPGQVFLTNPNGMYFAPGASVDVGGLVATTHSINNADFMAGNYRFARNGATGSIVNEGNLKASLGGYIALLAPEVRNQGIIVAQMGTVALAAGEAYELQFDGNNTLANIRVEPSTIQALVENGNAVQAPGGLIILSAQAADRLQGGVVRNSGALEASGLVNDGGRIVLEASDAILHTGTIRADAAPGSSGKGGMVTLIANLANPNSTTTIDGSISARGGDQGGDGGFVETSGGRIQIGDSTRIDTHAPKGQTGTWLIDPIDFTIAAGSGALTTSGIGASALATSLGSSNVSIATDASTAGNGDIFVNSAFSWAANKLTLSAHRNINIKANMTASGTASLALYYGQGAVAAGNTSNVITTGAKVNMPAGTSNFTTKLGSNGVVNNYTVITSLGAQGSTTTADLQGMSGNSAANYVLGSDIDAATTVDWNGGAGFAPVGTFNGIFDGLGHTISNLTINRPVTTSVGLFSGQGAASVIRNVGLIGGSVVGGNLTGGLVGGTSGTISNSYVTGSVNGGSYTGGLVGTSNSGTISNSYTTGSVNGASYTGGLVGHSVWSSTISNSYAAGAVTGTSSVGGLVGYNRHGTINNSYATGRVNGGGYTGGLVGKFNYGAISNTYASGAVTGTSSVGGLVGYHANGPAATNSFWDVTTSGQTGSADGTGLTTIQMQTASNFTGFNFTTTPGATGNNWVMVDIDGTLNNAGGAAGATRPMLASEYSTTISNAHQLQLMAMDRAETYRLARDIDAAATGTANDVWSGSTFIPVSIYAGGHFTGTFDGLGHTISGLTINLPAWGWNVGLFGFVSSGTIRNVGLTGGSVAANGNVGGLAGASYGTISNSYNTGTVRGSNNVGGLVGLHGGGGSISNSYATGAVTLTGGIDAGGLVGYNYQLATISNSYATGAVSGATNVGGLVGWMDVGTLSNSYSIGSVSGSSAVGGLVGKNTGTVTDSFWNTQTSGQSTSAGGTGKTTVELKTRSTYPSSWDFATPNNEVWNISPSVNGGYPFLCSITGGCVVQLGTTTIYLRLSPGGSSVYGDTPSFTYAYYTNSAAGTSVTDASPTGSVVWSGAPTATSNVGIYSLTYGSGITLGNSAYALSAGSAVDWLVTARPLNLAVSKNYDGSPSFGAGFVLTGMVNSNSAPTVSGSASVASANAANYSSFSSSTLALNNANYTLTGGTIAASIGQRALTVTASDASKTYGQTPTLSAFTASGLQNSETIGSVTETSAGTAATASVAGGPYAITPSAATGGSFSAGNYSISYANGNLTVTPAALTVTADDKSRLFGEANPILSTTVSGFVNGENASTAVGFGGTGSATTTATPSTAVGTAIITAGAGTLTASNYVFTRLVNGTLTIDPARPAPPPPPMVSPPLPTPESAPPLIAPGSSSGLALGSGTSGGSTFAGTGDAGSGGISVSLIRQPSVQQAGIITVSVPKEMTTAGSDFSFPLPTQLAQTAAADNAEVRVTTLTGGPLPGWLRYDPETRAFSAAAVPDGAFPMQVTVSIGNARVTVVISERSQ